MTAVVPHASSRFSLPQAGLILVVTGIEVAIAVLGLYRAANPSFNARLFTPLFPIVGVAVGGGSLALLGKRAHLIALALLVTCTAMSYFFACKEGIVSAIKSGTLAPACGVTLGLLILPFCPRAGKVEPENFLLPFYRGKEASRDGEREGATLAQMQAYFEKGGDFTEQAIAANPHHLIQWLFPLKEKSRFNPHAPLLDTSLIKQLSEECEEEIERSFSAFLAYLGLAYRSGKVVRTSTWEERHPKWVKRFDHNYKRITRVLTSLYLLQFEREARALQRFLICDLHAKEGREISEETLTYWKGAIPRPKLKKRKNPISLDVP